MRVSTGIIIADIKMDVRGRISIVDTTPDTDDNNRGLIYVFQVPGSNGLFPVSQKDCEQFFHLMTNEEHVSYTRKDGTKVSKRNISQAVSTDFATIDIVRTLRNKPMQIGRAHV